jgi:26S proteasome regulatory subunit N1
MSSRWISLSFSVSTFVHDVSLTCLLVLQGMMSATASLGLILLWDVDAGLSQIDKYLYATEDFIKAGALLACGIVNCGVKNECDPALAILSEYVLHNTHIMRIGAIVGYK